MSDDPTQCGEEDVVSVGTAVGYRGGLDDFGNPHGPVERLWTFDCQPAFGVPVVTQDAPGPEAVGVVRNA